MLEFLTLLFSVTARNYADVAASPPPSRTPSPEPEPVQIGKANPCKLIPEVVIPTRSDGVSSRPIQGGQSASTPVLGKLVIVSRPLVIKATNPGVFRPVKTPSGAPPRQVQGQPAAKGEDPSLISLASRFLRLAERTLNCLEPLQQKLQKSNQGTGHK